MMYFFHINYLHILVEVAKAQSTLKQPLDVQPLKYTEVF